MKRLAIIDMGTNTFHLLIAEVGAAGYSIVYRERLAVKIGMGGINQGIITEDGLHRALLAVQSFKNTIEDMGVKTTYAYGTSALRNARNRQEIIDTIYAISGITVNVISGDREAEFIYWGVTAALDLGEDKNLIMDIGGGSIEFIIANHNTIFWKQSFETGAQRLLEKFQKHDPIQQSELKNLENYFEESFPTLVDALTHYQPRILVGSSGTFDTLSDIFCSEHDIHKAPEEIETPLTLEGFYSIYDELLMKNREQRMKMPGMIEMRVDMIVVASSLIRYVLQKHHFTRIRVSTYALKEGVLAWLGRNVAV